MKFWNSVICVMCFGSMASSLFAKDSASVFRATTTEIRTEDGDWEMLPKSADLTWLANKFGDERWYRFRFSELQGMSPETRYAFSPGVVTSVCEIYLNGEKIGAKGNITPQTGALWMGRTEVFELPAGQETGGVIEIEMRVKAYGSRGGLETDYSPSPFNTIDEPVIDEFHRLKSWQQNENLKGSYLLIGFTTLLGCLLIFSMTIAVGMMKDLMGWAFCAVVLAELSDLFSRASVLLDFTVQWQISLTAISIFFWAFMGYSAWLIFISRLANQSISPGIKWFTIVSAFFGLAAAVVGVRDSNEQIFYPLSTLIIVIGFFWGTVLVISLARKKARNWNAILICWILGHVGLLVEVGAAASGHPFSEKGWWVSPLNVTFLFPLSWFGKLAIQNLMEQRQRSHLLADRIVTVQEDERRILARELHDGAAQNLQALKLQLELAGDSKIEKEERERIIRWLEMTAEEIRQSARHLHPSVLEKMALGEAIKEYSLYLSKTGLDIQVDLEDKDPEVSRLVSGNLYRIFQEAVANSIHHGEAETIHISLKGKGEAGSLELIVKDDGKGFAEGKDGLGKRSIVERATLCNGTAEWKQEEGTTLVVCVHS